MAEVVQNKPKVVNTMKRVKEEIVRFDIPTADLGGTLGAGDDLELQLWQGSGADYYTVRIGEGMELLSLGTKSFEDGTGWIEELFVQDFNGSEWNRFFVMPEEVTLASSNELPFNRRCNFERLMMSWGYKSFLTSNKDIAPTLKMPEGDRLRVFIKADDTNGVTWPAAGPANPTVAIARRYLPGSDIDYKHFDQYDGGIKSTKRYYSDFQVLANSGAGNYEIAWDLTIIRNEAYKFFQAGVVGSVAADRANLVEAKIMIDDPLTEYNKYFVNPAYNVLPWVNTYQTYVDPAAAAPYHELIETTHRFAPTIDVIKNRNKNLTLYVKDGGVAATNVVSRFYGIRYIL